MGTTRARLGRALVVVEARLVTLGEAWGTAAGESTDGIDAQELAIVLPRGALVQVSAGPAVVLKQITPGAGAQEAAFRVSAEEGTWLRVLGALVHIQAGGGGGIRCVPGLAVTTERAHAVDALAVGTQVSEHAALVHISSLGSVARAMGTQLLVGRGAGQRAQLTAGAPAPAAPAAAHGPGHSLAAAPVGWARGLQHLGEAAPLPDIVALGEARAGLEALLTVTPEAAHGVDAPAMGADAGLGAAFILIYTAVPGARLGPRARRADACKGADEVLAQHAAGVAVL